MTVAKIDDTNASREIEHSSAIFELKPRSLAPNHDRIVGDPPEPFCDVLGSDLL